MTLFKACSLTIAGVVALLRDPDSTAIPFRARIQLAILSVAASEQSDELLQAQMQCDPTCEAGHCQKTCGNMAL